MLTDILLGVMVYGIVVIAVLVSIPPISVFTLFVPSMSPTIREYIEGVRPTMTVDIPHEGVKSFIEYTVGYAILLAYMGFVFSIIFTGWVAIVSVVALPSIMMLFGPVGLFTVLIIAISKTEFDVEGRLRSVLHPVIITFLEQKYSLKPEAYRDGISLVIIGTAFTFVVLLMIYYIAGLLGLVVS